MSHLQISQVLLGLTAFSCALAWLKGGRAEKLAAALIAADWLFISAAQSIYVQDHRLTLRTIAAPALAADLLMCFGFLWLMLRHGHNWLGLALIIQGAQLAVYGSFIAGEGARNYTHALLINTCSFLLLDTLLLGTGLAWWRRSRGDRSGALVIAASA